MPDDLADIISLASALAEIHRMHIPTEEEQEKEFIELADNVIEESERAFGVSSGPSISFRKSLLSFDKALMLLKDCRAEDSKVELQRALRGFHESLDESNETTAARLETILGGKTPDQVNLYRKFLRDTQSGFQKFEIAWEMMSKEALGYADTDLLTLPRTDIRKAGHPVFEVWGSFAQLQRGYRIASSNLEFYEKDIDRGHWGRAMSLHSELIAKSLGYLNFDEALDHINAQGMLAEQHGVADEFQDRVLDARHFVNIFQPVISSLISKETISEDQFASFQKEFVRLTEKRSSKSAEMDTMLDFLKESLTADVDASLPHNAAPGILAEGEDVSAMLRSRLQKCLAKSNRISDYQQLLLRSSSNVLTSLQKLEHAEDESNEHVIFPCLKKLEQLSEDEQCREFLKKDAIQTRREWNTGRLLSAVASEFEDMMDTDKIDERQKLLRRCENIMALSGDTRSEVREFVDRLPVLNEGLHLGGLTKPAYAASNAGDHKTAILLMKDIFRLVEDGTFSRALASEPHSRSMLQTIQREYRRSSVLLAVKESRWADGLKLFSEWRSHEESWNILMMSERHETMIRTEVVCREMLSLQDFFGALQELDLLRSASQLGDIRSSFEAQTTTKGVISQTVVDLCGRVFKETFLRLTTAGPDVAQQHCLRYMSLLKERGLVFLP